MTTNLQAGRIVSGIGFVFLLLGATVAPAQNFSIDWWSVDGGGGVSTGGAYSLSGTIGQPDAGKMTGGSYTLEGGFWGMVAVIQSPDMPQLYITNLNNTVSVCWPLPAAGCVLEQCSVLTATPAGWSQVPFPYQTNASFIYIEVNPPAGNQFYRLRRP